MPFIVERISGDTTTVERLAGEELTIGSRVESHLRLEDPAVASEHAVLRQVGHEIVVIDRSSPTGTYVNGHRVRRAPLRSGDQIRIGGHRLSVTLRGPGTPVELTVLRVGEDVTLAAGAAVDSILEPHAVDYERAYALKRRYLSIGLLSLVSTLAALAFVSSLTLGGRLAAFRPGGLSRAHAATVQANECARCHVPWRGATSERCGQCHAVAEHHPARSATPSCGDCHAEHRSAVLLSQVPNRECAGCHQDIHVDGREPRFAKRVTDFTNDHPDFSVTLASGRAPLASLVAVAADPTPLRLNHALHLRAKLPRTNGQAAEPLTCASCHALSTDGRGTVPISYEAHCAECHPLVFDTRFPPAPHDSSQRVYEHILGAYAAFDQPNELTSAPDEERRLAIFSRSVTTLSLEEQVEQTAFTVTDALLRASCQKCHPWQSGVTAESAPIPGAAAAEAWPPEVDPPRLPQDWLPHARFSHARHRSVACLDCHPEASSSTSTADVLIPGIAVCHECHGKARHAEAGRIEAATTLCVSCHAYHGRSGVDA